VTRYFTPPSDQENHVIYYWPVQCVASPGGSVNVAMDENDSSALSRRRVVGAVGIGMAVSRGPGLRAEPGPEHQH